MFQKNSSTMKFAYLDLKNDYSNDNKYLAVVTENGLWIKDEIDEKISTLITEKTLKVLILKKFQYLNLIKISIYQGLLKQKRLI